MVCELYRDLKFSTYFKIQKSTIVRKFWIFYLSIRIWLMLLLHKVNPSFSMEFIKQCIDTNTPFPYLSKRCLEITSITHRNYTPKKHWECIQLQPFFQKPRNIPLTLLPPLLPEQSLACVTEGPVEQALWLILLYSLGFQAPVFLDSTRKKSKLQF